MIAKDDCCVHFDLNSLIGEYSLSAKTAEQWKAAWTK